MAEGRRERKVVTVLFADLVGFTSRAEEMDPEDVAAELGRYQARIRSELERYGGTVEKFIGDAAMAIFGAPAIHEDDPERAVRAALEIREWAGEEGIEVRIGVNTGEALVTLDAHPEAGETMAAGDVVNTAARLQSAAPVNGILAGEKTFRATERIIDYEQAEPVDAKGKAQPVPAWLAVDARSRIAVDRVHGATLVGRRREVDLLVDALDRVIEDRSPQLVTVVGVPGIGKSRLVLELFGAVERHADLISWRQGRCLPYGDGVTFWALGEMVKAQAGILEGDDAAEAERKLGEAVGDSWIESHLRPLVGLAGTQTSGDARDEAFTAWRQFFEGLADQRPLVLVFEDLHWADDHLLAFVDELADRAGGVPLLLVCTARPELLTRRADWGGGKPNALTISLSPLSDDDTARLLTDLLGSLLPAETQVELLARAGGNPLYAEEFVRMFRDRSEIGPLPENVQGLIAARLDLLDAEHKSLLQDASVLGKRFWVGGLAALRRRNGLDDPLRALERKEFVRRERSSAIGEDSEYSFRHLLVRDVAYGQIPRAERADKHLAAAHWLEQLARREDHAEMLAHHYLQALELTQAAGGSTDAFAAAAAKALADAGERAVALNAHDTAVRFFRAARDLQGDDHVRARLLYRVGRSLYELGETDVALLEQARDELIAAGDVEGAAEAEVTLCEHFWLAADHDAAMYHLGQARGRLENLPPSHAKARATVTAARLLMLASEENEAIRVGQEALAMAEDLGLDGIRGAALITIGSARGALGDDEGLAEIARGVDIARSVNAVFDVCRGTGNSAAREWARGHLAEAHRLWIEAESDAEQYGQLGFARWFHGVLANPEVELGCWDEARARADAFLVTIEAGGSHYMATQVYFSRALVRLGRGDPDGAIADVERSLELARGAKDPQAFYPSCAVAAHIFVELSDPKRALPPAEEFLAGIAGAPDIGFADVYLGTLSWALTALGRGEECAEALRPYSKFPWARSGIAFGSGDPVGAADLCAEMGAVASEAYCRLVAARAGDLSQLEPALSFYRSVDATRYVRELDSLVAAAG